MKLTKHWQCTFCTSICNLFSTHLYGILWWKVYINVMHLCKILIATGIRASLMEQYVVNMSHGCAVKDAQSTGPQIRSSVRREAGGERLTFALKLLQNYVLPCLSP